LASGGKWLLRVVRSEFCISTALEFVAAKSWNLRAGLVSMVVVVVVVVVVGGGVVAGVGGEALEVIWVKSFSDGSVQMRGGCIG